MEARALYFIHAVYWSTLQGFNSKTEQLLSHTSFDVEQGR
ncbi:hypothetical protein PHET_11987 [Paragonimus heterotremus]|uniref:Uncharacterized protein n=1 Tax=Paragonimus heterotremus TaxID=100268 RepID=A0A8J4SY38_9TREM|nr:hypothetical protein PHET_11987 [Paragonimus heterotremus]